MIVAILRSRYGVEIEINSQSVFSSPGKRLEEVLPADVGEEGFSGVRFDDPERNGDSDPIESSGGNFGEIFLSLFVRNAISRDSTRRGERGGLTMNVL